MNMDHLAHCIDQVSLVLRKFGHGRGKIQSNNLVSRIKARTDLTELEIRNALISLNGSGKIFVRKWHPGPPAYPLGSIKLNFPPDEISPDENEWRDILHSSPLNDDEKNILAPLYKYLSGIKMDDKIKVLEGLIDLRDNQTTEKGNPLFIVSARYFLGSSKMLSNLPKGILCKFGIEMTLFESAPRYIIIAGPADPKAVIMVENPHSFEMAIHAGGMADQCVWMSTYGYGLSLRSNPDEYGNQLVDQLQKISSVKILVRKGSPGELAQLLKHPNLFFWGDLDREGVGIYLRLRSSFPGLRISALYKPMIDLIKNGHGHPYCILVSKDNQREYSADIPDADALLNLCQEKAVDQESVSFNDISILACEALF